MEKNFANPKSAEDYLETSSYFFFWDERRLAFGYEPFTCHYLSDWLLVFSDQLKLSTTDPLFVEAASLLEVVWPALVKWHDWTVDPASPSTVGIAAEPESPYECGAPNLVTQNT